ncbi:OPT oligopeptide transporter protein-domain-containing protein [Syncephalis pseudoplumigaleata]|uniref:OPT oligopeptide transporter protein-domain-containing protein n=1 Tax=Syncephalis pseudoplumigaleata TaxID=1712513 RepID=A0A4P9YUC0_9FUNG|nr:OPT oligopeptide transporter protein-domain-containing protein [Syncephalis pseudoplumigaleata]|eukprot:RKP23547.1 OPT oligopeptide transporter protein-domain-containing protein [Syncephalis pseudoplumigaleata]
MTIRFWVLGIFFTIVLSFVNQFFWFRETPLTISVLVAQLLSYPLGRLMARALPDRTVGVGSFSFSLNPGPFNIKEHVLITGCANAAASTAYAIDIVVIKRVFYHQDLGFFPSFLLVVTTQCLGYGLAGMARRFLIRPAAMIWPSQLVNVSLFRTLHEAEEIRVGRMTRLHFFSIATLCSFAYYFLPGYLASFLSTISLLCYIAPSNKLANQLGSGSRGLGLLAFSLDWNYVVSFLLSPLSVPFWAAANIFAGFVLVAYIIIPIGYYNNFWDSQQLPIFSSALFTSTNERYPVTELVDANLQLNEAKYAEFGAPRMTFMFASAYGIGFAGLAAVISHTILYHGKEIVARFRDARSFDDDVHARLMDRYDEVPDWWYGVMFVVNAALAIVVCEVFGIDLPWWGLIMAVALAALFVIPIGIITAVTNQTPGLNIITEMIIGFILPGRAIANVTFKTYGYISMYQAIVFLGDLKLGHYMKIPPRHMFIAQTVGTFIAGLVNLGTAYLMFNLIPNICHEDERVWNCSNARVFYAASVIWGVIGPNRMFGSEGLYSALNWWFLAGFLLPLPFWLLSRRYPNSWVKYIHIPVLLGSTAIMPPAQAGMYTTWFILAFVFQFYIYRYRNDWWSRFNYILSAGMDSGVALAGLLIFFIFQYSEITVDWWGTLPDCPTFKVL